MARTDPGQTLVAGFPGTEVPPRLRDALRAGRLGGLILFKRNIESLEQVRDLCAALEAPAGAPPLIGVDQEGGRVARLGAPVLRLPPMRRLTDPQLAREAGETLGRQLRQLGFTMDFAPVLDVDSNPANPVIGDRAFGRTAEEVVARALPFAEGLAAGGVLPCGKHFPGHGDTDTDSHLALPRLGHDRARLDAVELAPFRAAAEAKLPALMSAHVLFESLDPEVPATLSRRVMTDLLRGELGYDGVVISDDLEMKAVADRWSIPGAAVRAIDAGCDVLLICSDVDATLAAREALVREAEARPAFAERLEEAARRALVLRRLVPPTPGPIDDSFAADPSLVARLDALAEATA